MRLAVVQARLARDFGEVPVGAIVVSGRGEILGRGFNRPCGSGDPTSHAECEAIRAACKTAGNYRLNDAILIVTLEPCLMCAGAIIHARLAGVVYGAPDPAAGVLDSRLDAFDYAFHNHHPWRMGKILETECSALLNAFFSARRPAR